MHTPGWPPGKPLWCFRLCTWLIAHAWRARSVAMLSSCLANAHYLPALYMHPRSICIDDRPNQLADRLRPCIAQRLSARTYIQLMPGSPPEAQSRILGVILIARLLLTDGDWQSDEQKPDHRRYIRIESACKHPSTRVPWRHRKGCTQSQQRHRSRCSKDVDPPRSPFMDGPGDTLPGMQLRCLRFLPRPHPMHQLGGSHGRGG